MFDEPECSDVFRADNPHVGFGSTGSHYCVGANLARLEIDLIFSAIAEVTPGTTEAAPPERLRSSWLNGIKHYQVRYGRAPGHQRYCGHRDGGAGCGGGHCVAGGGDALGPVATAAESR